MMSFIGFFFLRTRLGWPKVADPMIKATSLDHAPNEMKARGRPILWSMDEAGRIGIPNLPEHASTVVGRKISLSLSAQSRAQFNAIYGRDRTENLFNNIRT